MTLDNLVNYIRRGRVIPIIGSELCYLSSPTRPHEPIYTYKLLAQELSKKLDIESSEDLHVVAEIGKEQKQDIYTMLNDIYDDIEKGEYAPYRFSYNSFEKLINMDGLKIYLSVNLTDLLQSRLRAKLGAENVQVLNFSLSQTSENLEKMGTDDENPNKVTVINLLGSIRSNREFAITEEEYLEYFFHIISGAEGLFGISKGLLNKIKTCSFVYLGCSFPVWYARYIVRGLTQKRYLKHTIMGNIFIDEYTPTIPVIKNFLKKYRSDILDDEEIKKLLEQNPGLNGINRAETFVNILSAKYHQKLGIPQPAGEVFICYYSEDRVWAERIYEFLISEKIDCWLDETDLPAGPHLAEIREKLGRCRVFLPVFSAKLVKRMEEVELSIRNSLADPAVEALEYPYCVREEWDAIFGRFRMEEYLTRTKQQEKIIPFIVTTCLVDGVTRMDKKIPPSFQAQKSYNYPVERQQLADDIKNYLTQR